MGFEKMNGFGYGNGNGNGGEWEERESNGKVSTSSSTSSLTSSPTSSPVRYIEHHVTKLDTLAGVAIRYGVEVADIKKMNGLVSDLQMFARNTLHIPLPGRHPPSPCLSNGHSNFRQASSSEQTPRHLHNDLFESFQSLKTTPERNFSPSMSSLQSYYSLKDGRRSLDSFEMTIYNKESSHYHENGGTTTSSNSPLGHHRRSGSIANGFETKDSDPTIDRKIDTDKLLKVENGSGGGWFSGKGLALRTKTTSRTNLVSEAESITSNGDIFENSSETRRSSSTSNLHDQDINNVSNGASIWFGLKPDLPVTGRRGKTALD